MANWCGIEGLKYIYNGDYSDPQIEYRGIKFNERDVQEALQNDLEEDIASGEVDAGMTFEEYVEYRGSEAITSMLDDWIWGMLESGEILDEMIEKAGELFEDLDYEYCNDTCDDIIEWANQSDENRQALFEAFDLDNEKEYDADDLWSALRDNFYSEDFADFADQHNIENTKPYIIYMQNGNNFKYDGEKALIEGIKKLSTNENYLYTGALVFGVNGVVHKGDFKEGKEFLQAVKKELSIEDKRTEIER